MDLTKIIFIFAVTTIMLSTINLKESFVWFVNNWLHINTKIDKWDTNPFTNLCLTKNNSGYNSPAYTWWQDRDTTIVKEYKHCHPNWIASTQQNCSGNKQPLPQIEEHTRDLGKTSANSIDLDYYHNPKAYCKANPNKYPCPNHWIETAGDAKRSGDFPTENMRIPSLQRPVIPQVPTPQEGDDNLFTLSLDDVKDNKKMSIIHPWREDHVCRNNTLS